MRSFKLFTLSMSVMVAFLTLSKTSNAIPLQDPPPATPASSTIKPWVRTFSTTVPDGNYTIVYKFFSDPEHTKTVGKEFTQQQSIVNHRWALALPGPGFDDKYDSSSTLYADIQIKDSNGTIVDHQNKYAGPGGRNGFAVRFDTGYLVDFGQNARPYLDDKKVIRLHQTDQFTQSAAVFIHFVSPDNVTKSLLEPRFSPDKKLNGFLSYLDPLAYFRKVGFTEKNLQFGFSFGLPVVQSSNVAQYYVGFSTIFERRLAITYGIAFGSVNRLRSDLKANADPYTGDAINPGLTETKNIARPFISVSYSL